MDAAADSGTDGLEYLDRLQEKMEERLARRVPIAGRFCGFCYGRLRETDATCPFCASRVEEVGTTPEIPQAVLRAYQTKQRTEARWVHTFAFSGLTIASVLFVLLVTWGPGPLGHPALAFAVLIGGGYMLARGLGELVGAQIGFRRGVRRRNELWLRFVRGREASAEGDPKAEGSEPGTG